MTDFDSSTQQPSHVERLESATRWIGDANLQTGGALLLRLLHAPEGLAELSLESWSRLIPLAKYLGLWPQIAIRAQELEAGLPTLLPVWPHIQSAVIAAGWHESHIRWEVNRLQVAMTNVQCPVILLKGTAFLLSGFAFAKGRRFRDLDILVSEDRLTQVELALRQHGWVRNEERPLDLAYYRKWLHELAPMWHPDRKVPLDVHYTIIPPKHSLKFNPSSLFERAIPLGDGPFRVLSPGDMFLHAASNLFRTGEFTYLLRDLWDMYELVNRFTRDSKFWGQVLEQAVELNLRRECYLSVRYLQAVCGMAFPTAVLSEVSSWKPALLSLGVYDALVRRCLFPRCLDRLDRGRDLLLKLRESWPPPRPRVIFSYLYWRKRLPTDPLGALLKNVGATAAERGRDTGN